MSENEQAPINRRLRIVPETEVGELGALEALLRADPSAMAAVAPMAMFPPATPGEDPLGDEQRERFCQEVLMYNPAVLAYQRAFPGTSAYAARVGAYRLMEDAGVSGRLNYLREDRRARLNIDADEIHMRLALVSRFDPADLYDSQGKLLPIRDLPFEVRLCIESIEFEAGVVTKITTTSKARALEMLAAIRPLPGDRA